MFKFLRKYSVWILSFGGTLLLIAFVAPDVIQRFAQEAGTSGTIQARVGNGETVGYKEWQKNQVEAQIIDDFFSNTITVDSPSHWFLLTREADIAGLTPPIQIPNDPNSIAQVNIIARQSGASGQTVLETFAHLQGVQRLMSMYRNAGKFSDRRLQKAADDYFSTAAVETVVIDATPQGNETFSNDAMQAQLDAWANTPAGEGDFGFGYQLPDRFKTEWLVIPSSSITTSAKQSPEFSTKEQRKFWRRNENDPRFPEVGSTTDIPEIVQNAYLETLTAQKRTEISRSAAEHLRNPRRGFNQQDGFLDLPDDWDAHQISYESLATTLQSEFSIALPEFGSISTWASTADANATPVIGTIVAVNQGERAVPFETLVDSAKEFAANGTFRIQERVSSPVIEDTSGDLVLFRLTETDAARAPHTLAEVQSQVEYDLGRIASWEKLQADASSIEQSARENGLLSSSIEYNTEVNAPRPVSLIETGIPSILSPTDRRPLMANAIGQQLALGAQIKNMATSIPSLEQNDRDLIQSIMDRADTLPLDVPIAALPVDKRIFVTESNENMALVLVRFTGTTPASTELAQEFVATTATAPALLPMLLSFDELGGLAEISNTFSFDALAERHNFERGNATVATEETEVN